MWVASFVFMDDLFFFFFFFDIYCTNHKYDWKHRLKVFLKGLPFPTTTLDVPGVNMYRLRLKKKKKDDSVLWYNVANVNGMQSIHYTFKWEWSDFQNYLL